ncbi:MAG: Rep catalytic domain protein [Cressdnaviricota sp.]|nr:MAG: Rep catalytic domain protein [Cressdnaviricota sp.]
MSEKKKFRLQITSGLLTYKTFINKKKYIKWFIEKTGQEPIFLRLAHETGSHDDEEEEYEHTHVVFNVKKTIETTKPRYFDYNDIHPNIKPLKGKKPLNDAKKYIGKEDPENADLFEEENIVKAIWKKDNVQDALTSFVKKPNDAMGIVTLFNMKASNVELHDEDVPNLDWHIELLNEVKEKPNRLQRRKVVWYCDIEGGCEKTKLARYLLITEPQNWFVAKDMGTSKDAATVIKNALNSGWTGHGMIIDLPRQAANHKRMYSYIEEIKDGMVTTQKYSGQTCIFNIPHLIVFANWKPLFYMLSKDRWDVRILKRRKNIISVKNYETTSKDFVVEKIEEDSDLSDDED